MLAMPGSWAETAPIVVTDDQGNEIRLPQAAQRIVSLSPHTTEMLFAAGAGARLVGVSNYSDYPAAARQIASVGSINALDLEKILTLKPDLVVAWHSGNKASQVARLRQFGIPVFESQPQDFETIASSLERLGRLSGTQAEGATAAAEFRRRWQGLRQKYAERRPVSVFYQIWSQPLMTLNGQHMVSSVLRLCGGRNIFAELPQLAPTISVEAVLAADPEVILTPSDAKDQPLERWRQYGRLQAVTKQHLYVVNADWLNRAGPRILDATEQVCGLLEKVR
jgi:iron complex transport system substrate-binding protein